MSLELIRAASNGDLELIHIMLNPNTERNQLLLQAGRFPNVNYHEKTYGNTALHCAVQSGHQNVVDALISYGADQNATNNKGLTPSNVIDLLRSDYFEEQFEQQQAQFMGNVKPYDPYATPYDEFN